ncbi:MAG: NOP5/NOP56 family protein [Candidatus Nanohaloarchaea archaeon]|nr:NOP5/NOP56 family protein [Candidatus Nanohaloarchaea archaeon]
MEIAKNVAGVYLLEDGEVVEHRGFSREDLPDVLEDETSLEEEHPEAEETVLKVDRVSEISGLDREEIRERQVEAARRITRRRVGEAGGRDQILVQAVRALEDLDEINNEMSERLRPWYSLHFPELSEEVGDNERFAEIVAENAERGDVEGFGELAEESTGMEIGKQDAEMLEEFASQVRDSHGLRGELESYIEDLAEEVAPNLSTLLGGVLAARLISLAGSLEELAKKPSSTVQVLGAEKAMFRHMRGEGKAPKHGVLFMHEYVRKVPDDERGKMARVLANKASIAARLDNYGGEFKGEKLREEVKETYEEIKDG